MDLLAKKLLEHFMGADGTVITTKASIGSFMKSNGLIKPIIGGGTQMDPVALMEVLYYCEKLKNEGILFYFGNQTKQPFIGANYLCIKYDQEIAEYGGYEYLVQGFNYLQKSFENSVVPVEIIDSGGQPDIGTSFVIGPNLLVTAKHCIIDKDQIFVRFDGKNITPKIIGVFEEDLIDLCIIQTEGSPFEKVRYFDTGSPEVLMEVLTIGYPPIPGFNAIQISELSSIGAESKSSKGNIIGTDKSYLDGLSYFLINAKVKSGNSGSPVIDRYGRVVGIVTNIPFDSKDQEKLDSLGYGIALSSTYLSSLSHRIEYTGNFERIPFKILKNRAFKTFTTHLS